MKHVRTTLAVALAAALAVPTWADAAEPSRESLLIPPPAGAKLAPKHSATLAEAFRPKRVTRTVNGARYKAAGGEVWVYLTDQSLDEVVAYYQAAAAKSPHQVNRGRGANIELEQESPFQAPPDEVAARFGKNGKIPPEMKKWLAGYRKAYAALHGQTQRTGELVVNSGPDSEAAPVDAYYVVQITVQRPLVDPGTWAHSARTGIVYQITRVERQ